MIFTGFPGNMTWMAVASKWVMSGTSAECWTIPRRTRTDIPPPLSVCLCGGRYNWQAKMLEQGEGMSHLRDKFRHRASWENAPVQAPCRAIRPYSNRRGAELHPAPFSYGVLPYSPKNRITAFRPARGRTAPVGREEMDVRVRRVSSTRASKGRWSRRS